jgi:DNA (cytosine-5)-methyltransferase 1
VLFALQLCKTRHVGNRIFGMGRTCISTCVFVMNKFAYYNENDPRAAAWLRELIKAKLITDGEIDERSIKDVLPSDVLGFARCHFFAGIGGWDHSLNIAGYDRWDTVTWTGSCPCQPFSAAGKGAGFDDERHLWPDWFWLIAQCRPGVIFGEQVESAVKHGWLDLVQDDLEGIGYAVGAHGLPACSVGAPHIRQRVWFVADRDKNGCDPASGVRSNNQEYHAKPRRESGELVQSSVAGLEGHAGHGDDGNEPGRIGSPPGGPTPEAGATRGFWNPADWLPCRDGKARPVGPGTFPLAHGVPARVGRLRGYGNAIVPPLAAEVIKTYMERP